MREQCVKQTASGQLDVAKPFYTDVRVLERSDKNSTGGKKC